MTQLFFSDYHDEDDTPLQPLVIVGAGGLGREVRVLVQQLNDHQPTWNLLGCYDDQRPAPDAPPSLLYLGTVADLNATTERLYVVVAVGSSRARAAVVGRLTSPHLAFPTLIHPTVAHAPYQHLHFGAGCIIAQGCILTTDIRLGRHVLLNLGCTIGHDAVLEDFCSLMPHANVGGEAHLEPAVYLGTNATVINRVRVGAGAIVGAGAVAVRDLPAGCTAVGVPARAIKNEELKMKN
ncbi:sugar O-acyltransferase, sialic acid O-acetyltransferase NeuD family [Hymenobacter daecheongensis DSM 21074]|uniref:Sugar O-acyltransferase, sialic acid O-acetyltransferase NeuD family n=1 Tax=Hymenobacter daecheongensis DSM 21074 TaxID=1121955 RepID=A0A1M6GN86_9BACT|nr:NeuD/PglB/VioB family sugar acetyltransferase [Hymenobacter daecheongensis]SHJ11326.1 sugar O-acyltransferase, sialic acid O-acetyltransferase NeuD family [Hymenobacter daecheongensis DSM 21074]